MAAKRTCERCGLLRTAGAFPTPRARVCKQCARKRTRATGRATHLMDTYGITLAEYDALLKAQGGLCAGCGGRRRYNLHVDHDHALERALIAKGFEPQQAARASIRGLLCARCNKVLRDVRDNAAQLNGLAHYLARPPARAVLK